jgi:AcrR family transcriptional regulator
MHNRRPDRRSERTRSAIIQSFNGMVHSRRYDEIHVADIIRNANVGRSTFYEHFRNKDDVLRRSLCAVLDPLADLVLIGCDGARALFIIEHFHDNRRTARSFMNGISARTFANIHSELIAQRLDQLTSNTARTFIVPVRLAALQIAEMQLGLVRGWLNGVDHCPAAALAEALCAGTTALVASLVQK